MSRKISVIATTISGSISDWGKVKRIVPLFQENGEEDVELVAVDSHADARREAGRLAAERGDIIISAGGSGTFAAVLEGCFDSGVDLNSIRLGFLRKGSADLIGKVLGMPDDVEDAIDLFVGAIRTDRHIPCDVLQLESDRAGVPSRRFVGYGGVGLFGQIPRYTENRFMKYYKGILSQLLGDLGPFFVGMSLATTSRIFSFGSSRRREWEISVDGELVGQGRYNAMIMVNGDLGPNLPFARSVPLGSRDFHLFALRDLGRLRLFSQLKHSWDASILDEPDRFGMESYQVRHQLNLECKSGFSFPVNADGSSVLCDRNAKVSLLNQIKLLSA